MLVVIFAAILAISCGSPAGKFMNENANVSCLSDDDDGYLDLTNKNKNKNKEKKRINKLCKKHIEKEKKRCESNGNYYSKLRDSDTDLKKINQEQAELLISMDFTDDEILKIMNNEVCVVLDENGSPKVESNYYEDSNFDEFNKRFKNESNTTNNAKAHVCCQANMKNHNSKRRKRAK